MLGTYCNKTAITKKREMFAYISLLFCMLTYGSSFLAMKVVLLQYGVTSMMMFRMLISAMLFAPFLLTTYKDVRVQKRDIGLLLVMIICEPCLYFLLEANALTFTTSGQAGIVNSMLPLFITVGAIIVLREKVPLAAFWGFFVAIVGSIMLSYGSEVTEIAPNPLLGNFMELGAVVMTTISIIATKYLMEKYPPFFLAGFQTVAGAVFFTALNLMQGGSFHFNINLTVLIVIYLGFITVIDYALYNYAMCTLSASKASTFLYTQPLFAIIFGIVFLDETMTPIQIAAAVLIIAGLFLSQKKSLVKVRKIARKIKKTMSKEQELVKSA